MAIERRDRVKDSTTTTGTGTVTLSGAAPDGFRPFSSAHTTGATVRYAISLGTEWEVGEGIYTTSGNTLTRASVLASSNSGSLVSFSAGTKTVISTLTASDLDTYLPLAGGVLTGDLTLGAGKKLIFEGTTDDAYEATIDPGDPTADRTLTLPNESGTLLTRESVIQVGTPSTSTGVTYTDYSIPAGTKRITVSMDGFSGSGTSIPTIQLGDSGGLETSGYAGYAAGATASAILGAGAHTVGFNIASASAAAATWSGQMVLTLMDASTNTWSQHGGFSRGDTATSTHTSGAKSLSGELTTIRITFVNGTDTRDAGKVNVTVG